MGWGYSIGLLCHGCPALAVHTRFHTVSSLASMFVAVDEFRLSKPKMCQQEQI